MRLIRFSILISIVSPSIVFSQEINHKLRPRDSIVIDFKNDTSFFLWKLRYNTPYVVKLKNVNRFVYKDATATQTPVDFNVSTPSVLQAIKLPGFITSAPVESRKALVAEHGVRKGVPVDSCLKVGACPQMPDIRSSSFGKSFFGLFNGIKRDDSTLKELSDLTRELESLQKNVADPFYVINEKKDNLLTLHSIPSPYTDSSIAMFYKQTLRDAIQKKEGLDSISNLIIDTLTRIVAVSGLLKDSLRLSQCLFCKSCGSANYTQILSLLNNSRDCVNNFLEAIESIRKIVAKVTDAIDECQKLEQDGKFQLVQNDYNLLTEENFSLDLDEFKAQNDVHNIVFSVSAGDPQPSGQLQKRTIKITGITTGGMKVDFSAGAFINFGSDAFLGPQYYYVTVNDSTKEIQQSIHQTKAMLSVGGLLHAYWRLYSWIKPALSAGVSTTTGFDQVNLHIGVSAIIGKPGTKNRIVLSTGATLKESNVLDARYVLNTPYKGLPDAVPVSKVFPKNGWFLALTYNFSSNN